MPFVLRSKHLSATGTGILAPAGGDAELWTVNINTGAASATLKIYDGTSATGTLVAQIDATTKSSHCYGIFCRGGIYYDLSGGNADVTIGFY